MVRRKIDNVLCGILNPPVCKLWWNRLAVASLLFLVGCGIDTGIGDRSQGTSPPGYAAASTENLPLVDHPDYVSWSRFPVGMVVVRKKEVSNESGVVRVTTTLHLAEKTTDKVVVESQVTVDRPGQSEEQNPQMKVEFPATFSLPRGMQLEQFSLPSLKAKQIGEENRRVCGREYKTQLFTWEEVTEAGPMTVKLWRSEDIAGRMLRQEINGHMHDSVEEVVELIPPDGEVLGGP